MKKPISILLLFLLTAAFLHLSVSQHYCGDMVTAKVSLNAKQADCGMKQPGNMPFGVYLKNHCCETIVFTCATDNFQTTAALSLPANFPYSYQIFGIRVNHCNFTSGGFITGFADSSPPPGVLMATSVDLSDICILRI